MCGPVVVGVVGVILAAEISDQEILENLEGNVADDFLLEVAHRMPSPPEARRGLRRRAESVTLTHATLWATTLLLDLRDSMC